MTPQEEYKFEVAAEKMLAGHRQAPNGRNFLALVMRDHDNNRYAQNHPDTFKDSPALSNRLDEVFCPKCDKRRAWCECDTTT